MKNVSFPRTRNFLRLWSEVAQGTFPFMREEFGELDETAKLFVMICESAVKPEAFDYAKWKGIGRPTTSRTAVFKAFLFKALYDIPTTKELRRQLQNLVSPWAHFREMRRKKRILPLPRRCISRKCTHDRVLQLPLR